MLMVENDLAQRRASLKNRLAQLACKKQNVDEADGIIRKLEQSKDDAVSSHGEVTAKIQAQLDAVDQQDIASIIDGKTPSQESLDRRRALLQELTDANQALELKLEAARRSIATVQKQTEETRNEVAHIVVVQSQLRKTCSTKTRQALLSNEFLRLGLRSALADIRRRISVQSEHVEIHRHNKDEGSADGLFASQRLDDLQAAQTTLEASLADAFRELERLDELALSE